MSEVVRLPALIAGERVEVADAIHRVTYSSGLEVHAPAPTLADMQRAIETDRNLLKSVSGHEILTFFEEVAKAWLSPSNPWRRLALELGPKVTGYHRDNIERDIGTVGGSMMRSHLYDILETDLGDPAVLDEWTRYKGTYYRAWPKGLAAHIMVGNVPLAGFFTLVRSLAAKNITIAKTSRRDLVAPQCLAQCMYDVDPTHPVVRALTTTYWEPESDIESAVLEAANVVTVWGRAESIEAIKRRLRYNVDLIEFGPKRSMAVFLEDVTDWDRAALWLGFDMINYNQEACFSTQEAYVVGDPGPLAAALSSWLAQYAANLPSTERTPDADAHIQRMRMEAMACGWQVHAPAGADWTIVVTDGPTELSEHPLGRTIYIHPCQDVGQALAFVDDNVQGVTVEPFEKAWSIADALTGRGADRVIPLGRSARMREGFIHDGFHPIRRMIRWSTMERDDPGTPRFPGRPREETERTYRAWARGELPFGAAISRSAYRAFAEREEESSISKPLAPGPSPHAFARS